jgi:AcrR family transcriptional regulator
MQDAFRLRQSTIRNDDSGDQGGYPHPMRRAAANVAHDPAAVPHDRPLRADARRNHERILKAARVVFADQGTDAQIDDVARRAKVGVGTVYRHFPTKDALMEALVRERFDEIARLAEEALGRDDPWEAFSDLMWRSAELNARDRGFCDAVAFQDQTSVVVDCGLMARVEELMRRAIAQGAMRADATTADIALLMCGMGSVVRTIPAPEIWRRYVALMLDGLRAT